MHKYIYILSLFLLGINLSNAQVDRTKPPKPTAEPSVNFGEVTEMKFNNGMTVLVVENHKLPTVNFNIYFNNGPIYEGDKAGYASFLGPMMSASTENYTKEQLDEKIDYLGTDFYFSGSGAGFSALKKQLTPSLDLITEVLFRPTFTNENELEKLKKQQLTAIESEIKNPDAISRNVKGILLYGKDDPYGELVTSETINNIQLSDFPSLYQERIIPNNAYLTFVGDVTPKEVKKLVASYFKKWKKNKNFKKENYPVAKNSTGKYIAFVDLPTASQSVITLTNLNDYKKSNPDYFAAKLGNSILGGGSSGRLFKNIREDKGWTYGAYSSLDDSYDRLGSFSASAKVRNAVTDSAIVEFLKEINLLDTTPPNLDELNTKKAEYNGNFVMGLENPSTVATYTRTSLIENLPDDFYKNFLKNINAVTPQQVSAAMKKYTDPNNLVILVVGKGSEVVAGLETLNIPIKYFDNMGNEIPKPQFSMAVPDGVTVESILQNAINARGEKNKIENLKSLRTVYNGQVQGQQLKLTSLKMAPNFINIKVELPAMGMVASQQKFNGTSGSISQMGKKEEMPAEMIDIFKKSTSVIDEVSLLNQKNNLSLVQILPVNGQNAYQVDYSLNDSKQSFFFDMVSGLLVQTIQYFDNPQTGEQAQMATILSDYGVFNGVKFPKKITQQLPNMSFEYEIETAEINPKLSMEDFN